MSTEKLASLMGAGKFSKPLADAAARWGIKNERDQCRWLAQLSVESSGFAHVSELAGWQADALYRTFKGRNGLTPVLARDLVRQGAPAVLNFIYGGEWGRKNLGNTQEGDGWKFRGRGLIQLTGRENYRKASLSMYGDERLLQQPELLATAKGAADSAGWFWYDRKCNGIESVPMLTKRINAGLLHLDRRIAQTKRAYDLLDSAKSSGG